MNEVVVIKTRMFACLRLYMALAPTQPASPKGQKSSGARPHRPSQSPSAPAATW